MKRILLLIFFSLFGLFSCNSQIFSSIEYLDKFDDVIKKENLKTLIEINDSIITIETKGRKPINYYILYISELGKKDSVINLLNDIYGYEIEYYCIEEKDSIYLNNLKKEFYNKVKEDYGITNIDIDKTSELYNNVIILSNLYLKRYILECIGNNLKYNVNLPKEIVKLTYRIITTQYTMSYINQLFWIKKSNGSRIIYNK